MKKLKTHLMNEYALTHREADMAYLVVMGLANKEIAEKLFVCVQTVKFHTTNIYRKTHVEARPQLIVKCMRQVPGCCDPEPAAVSDVGLPAGAKAV